MYNHRCTKMTFNISRSTRRSPLFLSKCVRHYSSSNNDRLPRINTVCSIPTEHSVGTAPARTTIQQPGDRECKVGGPFRYFSSGGEEDDAEKNYGSKIHQAARAGNPAFAESLFLEMRKEYKDGTTKQGPNVKLLTIVLNAWTHSQSTQAPERAESLLMRIEQLCDTGEIDFRPNTISYSSAIQCWHQVRSKGRLTLCQRSPQAYEVNVPSG